MENGETAAFSLFSEKNGKNLKYLQEPHRILSDFLLKLIM